MKRMSRGVFDNETLRSIGSRIREARGEKTQEEFAKLIKVGRTVLANYEAGRRLPDSATLELIAYESNKSTNYLLTGMDATVDPFQIDRKYEDTDFEEGYSAALYIFDRMRTSFIEKSHRERLRIWSNVVPKLAEHLHDVIGENVSIKDSDWDTELEVMLNELKESDSKDILELIITLYTQNHIR